MFCRLGVHFLAHAHPLHECSIYRKGVDQFDLYLASGLGTSPDKNPKETKCETLVDSCSQQLFSLSSQSLACTQTPFGDIRVTDSKSSCTFCSYVACFKANIDSFLLRIELNCMPYCFTSKSLYGCVACHHRNYACYHLPTRGRVEIKLGDVNTSQTYLQFLLVPCMFCVTLPCFAGTFIHF